MINEKLTARVRESLSGVSRVEEKKMFGGVAFMVNGKMCVTASDKGIMCRVDPARMDELTTKRGSSVLEMKGREYRGYVRVSEDALGKKEDLDFWVGVALEFNGRATSGPKKIRKLVR
jgi:TfoX/Sxy family transcriptional regulator of competence genes